MFKKLSKEDAKKIEFIRLNTYANIYVYLSKLSNGEGAVVSRDEFKTESKSFPTTIAQNMRRKYQMKFRTKQEGDKVYFVRVK